MASQVHRSNMASVFTQHFYLLGPMIKKECKVPLFKAQWCSKYHCKLGLWYDQSSACSTSALPHVLISLKGKTIGRGVRCKASLRFCPPRINQESNHLLKDNGFTSKFYINSTMLMMTLLLIGFRSSLFSELPGRYKVYTRVCSEVFTRADSMTGV